MSCGSCHHFAASPVLAQLPPLSGSKPDIGVCRRYPPRIIASKNDELEAFFPAVHRSQSCGEHYDPSAIPC